MLLYPLHLNFQWLLYAIQFEQCFRGVRYTMAGGNAPVMSAEVATQLAKGVIEIVPPAEMRSIFYSPYFIVMTNPRPILLNCSLHRLPFKMLTARCIFKCVRPLVYSYPPE